MRAPAIRMEAVNAIHVAEGRRALREDAIPPLMDSIKRLGLQVPLAVRVVDECAMPDTGEVVCNVPLLVAGRHRLEACRRLGMETVPVVEFSDEREARLWEISENLHRAELLPVERHEQIAEWDQLVSQNILETPNPKGGRPGSAAQTARALNISDQTVRNAQKIAALPQDVRQQARDEKWTGARLLDEAKQRDPRHQMIETPTRMAPPPPPRSPMDHEGVIEAQCNAIMASWNKASEEARELFIHRAGL